MPISKNRQERLPRTNERLNRRNNKPVALPELAQWLGVSGRTSKRNVRYMREMFGSRPYSVIP